jgi:hypothetical protein
MSSIMEYKPSDDCSDIGGALASGALVKYTFGLLDATPATKTITTATTAAGNVGVITDAAASGSPAGCRFSGVFRLKIYPSAQSTEILDGDHLAPSTGGYGIKVDPDTITERSPYNAIALENGGTPGASVVGKTILVRIEYGNLFAEEVS